MTASMSCLLMRYSGISKFRRDNADFMNNFWVNIVARSYTNIEDFWVLASSNQKAAEEKEVLKELGQLEDSWKQEVIASSTNLVSQIATKFKTEIQKFDPNFDHRKTKNYAVNIFRNRLQQQFGAK